MTAYCLKCGSFDCQCSKAKTCSLCGGSKSGLFHICSSPTYDVRALELPNLDLSIPKYEPPVVLRNRELEEPPIYQHPPSRYWGPEPFPHMSEFGLYNHGLIDRPFSMGGGFIADGFITPPGLG